MNDSIRALLPIPGCIIVWLFISYSLNWAKNAVLLTCGKAPDIEFSALATPDFPKFVPPIIYFTVNILSPIIHLC